MSDDAKIKEQFTNLIAYLEIIYFYGKEIHYSSKGKNFYSDHKLMDRVVKDIWDNIDDIKEKVFLTRYWDVPSTKQTLPQILSYIDDAPERATLENLRGWVHVAIKTCTEISLDKNIAAGENDLVGNICSGLCSSHGFLNQRLKD